MMVLPGLMGHPTAQLSLWRVLWVAPSATRGFRGDAEMDGCNLL